MPDLPPYPDSNGNAGDDTRAEPHRGSTSGAPRWVKVFWIAAVVLILLVVVMLLTGGHGPDRHMPPSGITRSSGIAGNTPAGGHTP